MLGATSPTRGEGAHCRCRNIELMLQSSWIKLWKNKKRRKLDDVVPSRPCGAARVSEPACDVRPGCIPRRTSQRAIKSKDRRAQAVVVGAGVHCAGQWLLSRG